MGYLNNLWRFNKAGFVGGIVFYIGIIFLEPILKLNGILIPSFIESIRGLILKFPLGFILKGGSQSFGAPINIPDGTAIFIFFGNIIIWGFIGAYIDSKYKPFK